MHSEDTYNIYSIHYFSITGEINHMTPAMDYEEAKEEIEAASLQPGAKLYNICTGKYVEIKKPVK